MLFEGISTFETSSEIYTQLTDSNWHTGALSKSKTLPRETLPRDDPLATGV